MAVTKIHGERQIKDETIKNAQIATDAAIALSKLAEAVIQADGGQAFTGEQSMGGNKLTNLAAPTAANDAVRLTDLNSLSAGIDWKASVRVATTVAGTLASSFENGDTIDGIVLATGDRILIKDQAAGGENGIYTVNASGAPTRATDADASAEVTAGMATFVEQGTTNADTGWLLTTDGTITLGSTALVFTQFTGLGSVIAGAGLFKTGNTLDVGAGDGIQADADAITVKLNGTSLSKGASSGAMNGVNTTFTLANTPIAGSEHVYLNGILQESGAGNDYTISGATITYLLAPLSIDKMRVSYRK